MKKVEVYLAGRKNEVSIFAKSGEVQYAATQYWVGKIIGVDIAGGTNVADISDVRNFITTEFPEWDQQMVSLALDALGPVVFPPTPKREIEVFF